MPILKWSYYCKLSLLSVIFACIYSRCLEYFYCTFFFPLPPSLHLSAILWATVWRKINWQKVFIRFPRARTRRANSFPSPLLNHAESPEARDSSRKIGEGTRVHLFAPSLLSLRHPTQPNPHWADANNVCRYIVSHASLGPQIVL